MNQFPKFIDHCINLCLKVTPLLGVSRHQIPMADTFVLPSLLSVGVTVPCDVGLTGIAYSVSEGVPRGV